MLVRRHAVFGRRVSFHVGEVAKPSILAFVLADVFMFVRGDDSRDEDPVRGVAEFNWKMQKNGRKYWSARLRYMFLSFAGLLGRAKQYS